MERWIANRTRSFDSSGIRKVFDLAAKLENPVNLSIGQPDYDVPEVVKASCIEAIQEGRNGYALTQGIPQLRERLRAELTHVSPDRELFVCSGTSGGLVLAMLSVVEPGDEVILFDPFFVMYKPLVQLVGGQPVVLDTYPDFRIDIHRVADAMSPRTKMILLNSPSNPTGYTATREEVQQLAELAAERGVLLLSDEIYKSFCYDDEFVSPLQFNPDTLVIDGFSKSHAMTGWRVGYAHGPKAVIETMTKLQQYSFVCAPQPAQWAALRALDVAAQPFCDRYRQKRDRLLAGIEGHFEVVKPGGAFYAFPKAPWGTGSEFVMQAIENNLLVIPGNIFSQHDTHFRISYAASDETIDQGIEILNRMAAAGP